MLSGFDMAHAIEQGATDYPRDLLRRSLDIIVDHIAELREVIHDLPEGEEREARVTERDACLDLTGDIQDYLDQD